MAALIETVKPIVRWALDRPLRTTVFLTCVSIVCLWVIFQPSFFKTATNFTALAPDYEPQVRSLLAGENFGSFRYPPVFPLMLAGLEWMSEATGLDDGRLGALLLLACAISGSVLIFLLGNRIWGPRWGLFCVAVWLAYPVFWRLWLQPLSEAPFVVLLLGALLLLLRSAVPGNVGHRRLLLTGLVLGLAMLTRPSGIGLPVVFSLYLLIRKGGESLRPRLASASLLLAGALLAILPWEIHAYRSTGEIIPVSTEGVEAVLDGLTYAVDPSEDRPVWVPEDVRHLQWEIHEQSYRELSSISSIAAYLIANLLQRPAAVIQLYSIKVARAWYGTDSGVLDRWLLLFQIPIVTLLWVGVFKLWRCGGAPRDAGVLITMIVLYFWAITTAALSIVRYMVPALALMLVTSPALAKCRKDQVVWRSD
ncbi:MAG: glycosyltransferase family 39 protein [Thermoanaerobaculia bacterium]